jgi:hypothetical protein
MAIFKNYYFHNLTQRYILAFGSILTDIEIQRQDESGNVLSHIKVPVVFSNKEKWAQRALEDGRIPEKKRRTGQKEMTIFIYR